MAMSYLRYAGSKGQSNLETTVKGDVIYTGTAIGYYEWEFRVLLELKATKAEDMPSAITRIVRNLRGDAFQIAVDHGLDNLSDRAGITELMNLIKLKCFPTKVHEAKQLYAEGHKVGGILSRQAGESMLSYISR